MTPERHGRSIVATLDSALTRILLVAAGYAALEVVGKHIALPYTSASPLWPAAGFALACLMAGGLRLWPGVLLGGLAADLLAPNVVVVDAPVFFDSLLFALGPTAQACLGAWLVRRRRAGLGAGSRRSALQLTLLAGPVACMVSASWGVTLLHLSGYLGSGETLSTWVLWWFGDTLGVLFFAPLVLLAIPGTERYWPERSLRSALPLIGAMAILVPSVYWFHYAEEADARRPLLLQAERAADLSAERLRGAAAAVLATASYRSASRRVTVDEFEKFASGVMTDSLIGLAWVPRVPHDRIDSVVAQARAAGLSDFGLLERGPDGFRPAQSRIDHFPLLHLHVAAGQTAPPLGYDLASEPLRVETIARARDSGLPAASAPADLRADGKQSILLLVPVFAGDVDPLDLPLEQRRAALLGFVAGAIDPLAVASTLAATTATDGVVFRLADAADGAAPLSILDAAGSTAIPLLSRDIDFFGRNWRLEAFAPSGYWTAGTSAKALVFLLTALLGALLITVQTLAAAMQGRAVRLKVIARTRALGEKRRRLDAALHIAHIAGWQLDLERDELTLDDRSFELLGTSAAREGGYVMKPRDWVMRFVHPDDARGVIEALARAVDEEAGALSVPREFRVRRRDGEIRHLLMHFDVDVDEHGRPLRVLGSTQDITERKKTEIALRESEEYSRSILQSSRDCIKVLSLDGRLLDVNQAGCEVLGIGSVAEVQGSDWRKTWTDPADHDAACDAIDRAAAGGTARFTAATTGADGEKYWWDVVMSPIADAAGNPRSLLCVTRDITEERGSRDKIRRMNESLEEEILRRNAELVFSERELRAIFDVAAVGIAHVDRDNRVLRVNPRLCEIAGFEMDDFIAEDHYARTHPEDSEHEQKLIAELMSGEIETYELEKRYLRPDGRTIWVRVSGSLVRDDEGQPLYRVAVVSDISDARAESELRIASERRYRELFERNPMPMFTYDPATLAITSVNDAAVVHYGYSHEEFVAMHLPELSTPDRRSDVEALLTGPQQGLARPREVTHQTKDGEHIVVEISSHDVDEEGRAVRLVIANDVTERKRATELLEGQKRVLEGISAGAPVGESLQALARLAQSSRPGLRAAVMTVDTDGVLRTATTADLSPAYAAAADTAADGDGFFAELARCRDSLVVADIASDARWQPGSLRALAADEGLAACWSMPILDAAGDVQGVFVIYHDEPRRPSRAEGDLVDTLARTAAIAITSERETRRLRESEERFRQTFENAPLGMLHVGTDGRFTRANPSIARIIGYSEEELREHTADTLSHPEDVELGKDQRARLFAGEIPMYSVEKRYVRKDGRIVWLSVTISTVRNDAGAIAYAIALIEDISWRKEAEARLHEQQEINRLLLENLTEGVVACDADGQLMLFNKAAREWHGADPREIPAAQWSDYYDLFHSDGETPLSTDDIPLMRAFRGERVKNVEMSIVRKGHPPRSVLASGAPLLDTEGRKRGAVVVMHDVTVRRQSLQKLERAAEKLRAANAAVEHERASLARRVAERTAELTTANDQLAAARDAAEAASRAKSTFLAVMSHEIRTPMNGILGMVDVLSQSRLSDDQEDAVHTIRDSSFSLLRLIDDILDFSKVEAGRLELERTPTSLSDVVESVCDALTPEALGKDVDLRLFIEPTVPASVLGDPIRLRQLLYNLVGNAIKFSGGRPDLRGLVEVHVESACDAPLDVRFRVRDNGVGIAPKVLPTLFDSFTQAEVSTTRRFGGTGLGLAISKRLVELMGGRIEVDSTPGAGSEFTVHVPFEAADAGMLTREFDLEGLHTVLVEDDDSDTRALAAYLASAGSRVDTAPDADAAAALAAAEEHPVIVVRHVAGAAPPDAQLVAECAAYDEQVNLLITRGPRGGARILAPYIVVLQASAIRRRDFLAAVAVAAGRASPEVRRARQGELVRGQLVAPSVTQARDDGRLILVAEDDPINQKVILRQLALLGYAGELAANGAEALAMWRGGDYALLLTDVHMPELDGYELASRIRAEESNGDRLPILALTANALRGEAERARAAGFDAYLTKPLQLSVLGETLAAWIPPGKSGWTADGDAAPADAGSAVDVNVLRDIIGDDTGMLHGFLREYLDASPGQVAELKQALAAGDNRQLASRAHRQKGAARAIGATRLGDLCAELENAARAEDESQVRDLVARLEAQAAAVDAEIRRLTGAERQLGAEEYSS